MIQIIIYDKLYVLKERASQSHASIISKIDLIEKKIELIDPNNYNAKEKIIETIYDLKKFAKGWHKLNHLVIWVYPDKLKDYFKLEELDTTIKIQKKLDDFVKKT
jgi:hypothetical protein